MEEKLQIERALEPGGYLVRLYGTLDEGLRRDALSGLQAEVVLFDFGGLRRVTSFGVNQWLMALKELHAPYYAFINCRSAVVAQFNMVTNFGGAGHLISFYAPYLCESCDRELEVLIDLRQQHAQIVAKEPPQVNCPSCHKAAVFDDLPESYFSYASSRPAPKLPPLASKLIDIAKKGAPAGAPREKEAAPKAPGITALPIPKSAPPQGAAKSTPRLSYQTQRTARLLLLDAEPQHARMLGRVLRSAAGVVNIKKKLEDVVPGEWDLLLVNYDSLSQEERERLIRDFSPQQQRGKLVVYSSDSSQGDLAGLLDRLGLVNFLARNKEVDPEELYITVHKLLSQDIFGIDKYFSWGVRSLERALRSSAEQGALLETVSSFATDAGLQSRFVDMFVTLTRELVTNALYDAPVDAQGRQRFAHLSRNQEVRLDAKEAISISLCCDGRRIGVSVSDPFGSLTPERAIHYLRRCFRKGEAFSHFVINTQRGRRTEIIGLLEIQSSYLNSTSRAKSFTLFGDLLSPLSKAPGQVSPSVSRPKEREERVEVSSPIPISQPIPGPWQAPAAPPPPAQEAPLPPSPAPPVPLEGAPPQPRNGRWRVILAALALGISSLILGALGTIMILGLQNNNTSEASPASESLLLKLESEPSGAEVTVTINGVQRTLGQSPTELTVPYGAQIEVIFSKDGMRCSNRFTATQEGKIFCQLAAPSPAGSP